MNYITHKKRAASKLNLLDKSTDTILTGRDISEDDLGNGINDGYMEVVQAVSSIHPQLYEIDAYTSNYVSDAVIVSVTNGTALVVDDSIFTNGSVGCTIYNSTAGSSAKIHEYTAATDVVLDESVTWEADDVVYLLEREFTFTANITDYVSNLSMEVRYGSEVLDKYVPATMKLHGDDNDSYGTETNPIYVLKQINTADGTYQGFRLFPDFTEPDMLAIHQRYIALPPLLDDDTDVPSLPLGMDTFLFWKGVEYGATIRDDQQLVALSNTQFEKGKASLLTFFKPLRNLQAFGKVPNHYRNMLRKSI
jgi:hypothetical protein